MIVRMRLSCSIWHRSNTITIYVQHTAFVLNSVITRRHRFFGYGRIPSLRLSFMLTYARTRYLQGFFVSTRSPYSKDKTNPIAYRYWSEEFTVLLFRPIFARDACLLIAVIALFKETYNDDHWRLFALLLVRI